MFVSLETVKGPDMPVTLSVPPKVVRDVESFAARSGTTMDALVLAYLVKTATEERRTRSKRSRNPVLKFCGILPKGEAKRLSAVVSEQRVIDEEMWG